MGPSSGRTRPAGAPLPFDAFCQDPRLRPLARIIWSSLDSGGNAGLGVKAGGGLHGMGKRVCEPCGRDGYDDSHSEGPDLPCHSILFLNRPTHLRLP